MVVAYRDPVDQQRYLSDLANPNLGCPFCDPDEFLVETVGTMHVIANKYPYKVWESHEVLGHYMVVPVRHTLKPLDWTDEERADWWKIGVEYEVEGWSRYTRAPASPTRTVGHHHTHLIKVGNRVPLTDAPFIQALANQRLDG